MSARRVHMRVAPDPTLRVDAARQVPHQALFTPMPIAIVGGAAEPGIVTSGVSPDRATCFGPRGAALLGPDGPLWVSDTGHHRLLGWRQIPTAEGTPADWVIGQPDFSHEGRNAKGPCGATTLNVPTGVCRLGEHGMAVADAWNHRVLLWHRAPTDSHVAPDVVLGQANFEEDLPNRGADSPGANTLYWPYGVGASHGKLFIADAENRRVLIWDSIPTASGQPADRVLGQRDFACRDENAGSAPSAMSMRWPHGVTLWKGHLCVSDAGNNRIMVWREAPQAHGQPCDVILGQASAAGVDHNQSLYWPRANTLNMPYDLTAVGDWLLTADTASSRLLAWHLDDLVDNAPARALAGQANFHEKGDNRWQMPTADSLCWPYGITSCGDTVVVADSGNNRVSLWRTAL
ncbi:MAG: hypothetical protein AAGA68_19710 [Pseudomonadota bacterium]